jgi:signal transduction histidine kinase
MSLRRQMLAAFAYVIVLVLVALLVPLVLNLSRRVDAEVKAEAAGQVQLIASSAAARLGNERELERLTDRAADSLGGRVVVVNRRGRVLVDSDDAAQRGAVYGTRPEIANALLGETDQGTRHSDTLDQELLFTAVPVFRNGQPAGAVRATQNYEQVREDVREDALTLIALGGGALLLGLAVAWFLAGGLARPLAALAATARRVGRGDLDARAEPAGSLEHREVAHEFNEMTGRLGRALAAQREFAGNASHQLRTPLTGLKLRLEAAGYKTTDPDVLRDVEAAERETERLDRLLSDLLTLAGDTDRAHAGELVELGDVARAARERWHDAAAASGHELELTGNGAVCVRSSPSDLAAILDNLVENAINYSPGGSDVELTWGGRDHHAYLAVRDHGPGIPADEADKVFERFFRGSDSGGKPGTGLGLSIVETLARRWGGDAHIEPTTAGTSVRITLPREDAE